MGKYMRKAMITGEVAVVDVSHQPPLGVRTRARALALQRLQVTPAPPDNPDDPGCYLQLRSRRLEKTRTLASPRAASVAAAASSKEVSKGSASPNKGGQGTGASKEGGFRLQHGKGSENYGSTGEVAVRESCSKLEGVVDVVPEAIAKAFALAAVCETPTPADDGGVEASFGDNALDLETGDNRRTRETTPCSLIRDSENIPTPGSTSRPSRRKLHNAACRNIPTTLEMEEFFADAEQVLQQEQRAFMEKYNFDPVNDCPLPGRYEWVRVESL